MLPFGFQYPFLVWLLAAIPLVGALLFALLRWKKATRQKMGDPHLVNWLTRSFSPQRFLSRFIILSVGFAMGVIALMNPRKPGATDKINRKGIDVVVALDVSKSMLAADLAPSRLERARQFVNKLMDAMPDDRIGLVLFAGRAYLQMPLTTDHGAARLFVASASPDAVPQQGTVISDALTMSMNAFPEKEKRFKTIVLISDGEEHDPEAVSTARQLQDRGVMINTVGVGSPMGATFTDPATGQDKLDENGNVVVTKLNEELLKEVAGATNGIYVHLESSDDAVTRIQQQLSKIDSETFSDVSMINYKTYFMWFAGAMLLLLVAEIFISERKRVKA